jgi:hypothetical protein
MFSLFKKHPLASERDFAVAGKVSVWIVDFDSEDALRSCSKPSSAVLRGFQKCPGRGYGPTSNRALGFCESVIHLLSVTE